jgi:hypothetical protein
MDELVTDLFAWVDQAASEYIGLLHPPLDPSVDHPLYTST